MLEIVPEEYRDRDLLYYHYYLKAVDRFFYIIRATGGRSVECIKELSLQDINAFMRKEYRQIIYLAYMGEVEDIMWTTCWVVSEEKRAVLLLKGKDNCMEYHFHLC